MARAEGGEEDGAGGGTCGGGEGAGRGLTDGLGINPSRGRRRHARDGTAGRGKLKQASGSVARSAGGEIREGGRAAEGSGRAGVRPPSPSYRS